MLRIPITMCHGTSQGGEFSNTREHFVVLIGMARDMGFESINYEQLDQWMHHGQALPDRPIMFDFDHPVISMHADIDPELAEHGYAGNLFINTGAMVDADTNDQMMTWGQIGELVERGWHIGAHTVTHPNLSALSQEDPTGEKLDAELADCDAMIEKQLGITPRDFAFTGTSWSSVAEQKVMQRYRFGRLWIIGTHYNADGESIRYADLVGAKGEDEADGGPPMAARYITQMSNRYRLPSMEIEKPLIHDPERFRAYLEFAISG